MHVASPDFRVDISLNLLTLLVSCAIALALLWQLVILLERPSQAPALITASATEADGDEAGPPSWAASDDHLAPIRETSNLPLALPRGSVFRCTVGNRVTYADRPCEHGEVRVLRLPKG
jgi:hypothetical protein